MNPNRELAPLAPKSVPSHVSNQNRTKASSATTNSSAKGRRNRHSDAEWESQKDTIANLYVQEDLTAEEVLDKLEKDHSFKVGRRTLMKKISEWGLSKNIRQSDMMILLAKRNARMLNTGLNTVFYKDGQAILDDRLRRFSKRDFVKAKVTLSPPKRTPEGVSYMTPENDNEITEFIANLDFDPSVVKRFTTVEPITTIQGFLPPSSSLPNEIPHMHQIGVFGLAHTCNHLQRQDPAQMLFQAQSLAQNLLGIVKHPPESFVQTSLLSPVAKRQRVPKVWISVSEAATYSFSEPSRNRVIYQLKHSDFCHQLLGLSPIDRVLWKRTWGSMSEEERSKTEGLGRTFFGDPSQHYPLTSFLSIFVLMASEKGVKNTVFLRISLGLGDAVPLSCRHCERDVMLFDGIRATGALQLNVPSRQARSVRYESSEIIQSTEVEVAKWAERVGHLKGWWPCHFTKPLPGWASLDEDVEISRDKPFDLGIWDPDAKMEPAMCFQPYAQGAPDLWHPDRSSRKDYNMPDVFEPEPRNEEAWDPDGSFMRELSDDESDSDGT